MGSIYKQKNGKWRIRWTAAGERMSAVYTKQGEAARALRDHEREVEEIELGIRLPILVHKVFDELATYWLDHKAVHKRSRADDVSIMRCHLVKAFAGMKLREINVEAVDAFKSQRTHLKPHTLANILTLLRSMLRVAVKLQWLAVVPEFDKPKVQIFSHDYRYLRNDDEIARFLRAAAAEGALVYALFAVAVYTGMRAGEIAGLEWPDVDFERRLIRVERSYDGPTTKSGRVRWVPLLDPLLPVLRTWKLRHPGQLVFTGESGHRLGKSARVFQEVLKRVLVTAGFEAEVEGKHQVHYITFHGLRHTFASSWVAKGGDVFKLQKILGHQSIMLTMRYAHLAPSMYAGEHGLLGAEAAHVENATVIKLRTRNVKRDGAAALPPIAPWAPQGCAMKGLHTRIDSDPQGGQDAQGKEEDGAAADGAHDEADDAAAPHVRRARS